MIIDPKTREVTYTMEELQRIRSKLMVAFQLCHKSCPLALEALNDAAQVLCIPHLSEAVK